MTLTGCGSSYVPCKSNTSQGHSRTFLIELCCLVKNVFLSLPSTKIILTCRKKHVRSDSQNFALNHLHKRFQTSVHFRILSDVLIRFILSPRVLCPSEMTMASCYLARERPSVALMLKLCITKNWSFKRAPRHLSWSLSSGRIIWIFTWSAQWREWQITVVILTCTYHNIYQNKLKF